MKINYEYQDGLLKLSIHGDLDANSAIKMDNVIKKAFNNQQYKILIDCKALQYISSAGLGVFISYLEDFTDKQGAFIFFDMTEQVYNVFELLGLHNIFRIVPDENQAKNLLKHEN